MRKLAGMILGAVAILAMQAPPALGWYDQNSSSYAELAVQRAAERDHLPYLLEQNCRHITRTKYVCVGFYTKSIREERFRCCRITGEEYRESYYVKHRYRATVTVTWTRHRTRKDWLWKVGKYSVGAFRISEEPLAESY